MSAGFQPGCWGFGGEDKDTALEPSVGRGPHLWATSAAGTSPQGLTCIRGAWESALLLHRQVAEGRRNGPCGGSGNVLGGNMELAEESGASGTKVCICKEALAFRILPWCSGPPALALTLPAGQIGKFLASPPSS